jgi:hypothetical protein
MLFIWQEGPLGAVATIGAGMLLIGLAVIGRSFFGRTMPAAAGSQAGFNGGERLPEQSITDA